MLLTNSTMQQGSARDKLKDSPYRQDAQTPSSEGSEPVESRHGAWVKAEPPRMPSEQPEQIATVSEPVGFLAV